MFFVSVETALSAHNGQFGKSRAGESAYPRGGCNSLEGTGS